MIADILSYHRGVLSQSSNFMPSKMTFNPVKSQSFYRWRKLIYSASGGEISKPLLHFLRLLPKANKTAIIIKMIPATTNSI